MLKRACHAAVLNFVVAAVLSAQTPTSLPMVLRLPASTRYLGLGNAAVAGRDDDVVFYNPAQIYVARGSSLSAERYWPGNTAGAFSTVLAMGTGGLGVGAQWVGYSTNALVLPIATSSLDSAGSLTANSAALTVGIGRVTKGLRVGLSHKIVGESAPLTRKTLGFADLGVEKDYRQFAIALALQNVSTFGVAHPFEPSRVTLGTSSEVSLANLMPVSPFLDAAVAAQVSVLNDGWVKPAGGVEFGVNWIQGYTITARIGARRPEPDERALTTGATLAADRFRIDYALETRAGGNYAHRVGVRIR